MTLYVNRYSPSPRPPVTPRAVIHRADCAWALRFGGKPKWLGPFKTYGGAQAAAYQTGFPINSCG